jgi:hypothetical protein
MTWEFFTDDYLEGRREREHRVTMEPRGSNSDGPPPAKVVYYTVEPEAEVTSRTVGALRDIVVDEGETTRRIVPRYVMDNTLDEPGYVQTARIAKSADRSSHVMMDELTRIRNAVDRARGLAVTFGFGPMAEFDEILALTAAIETRVGRQTPGGDGIGKAGKAR